MTAEGIFFVLVGPSGAGKNTLMRRVKERTPDLSQVPTMTTRMMRPGEMEGREHLFVTPERFQQAVDQNELIEWQIVHKSDHYGTPRAVVETAIAAGADLVADIEFLGAEQIKRAFPKHAVLIFVTPSNLQILAERIVLRGDITQEELTGRINRARFEMTFAPKCQYLIVNDDREQAAAELRQIVGTERHRRRGDDLSPAEPVPAHRIDACVTAIVQRGNRLLLDHGALPRFALDPASRRLEEAARDHLERALGVALQLIGPRDTRFDYPAPSHVTVSGASPHFTLDYFYRFAYPEAEQPLPDGWSWAPLASVDLPEALSELATS